MKHNILRPHTLLAAVLAFLMLLTYVAAHSRAAAEWQPKVDEVLLAATSDGGQAEFLVVLTEQADLSHARRLADRIERGRYVYQTMTEIALRTQAPLRAMLDMRGVTYRPYWVNNMILVRGNRDLLQSLANRRDVDHIYANTSQRVALPSPATSGPDPRLPNAVEWNVAIIRAPQVWDLGFRGQGVVIGGQDTGYAWEHPAIKDQYRGWDGVNADHDYNWHDAIREDFPQNGTGNACGFDLDAPCDDQGHGTHTMGTMVGDDGLENQIGVAPDAQWIGCRNMEDGWGTPATYTECFEWFIAPYPINGDPLTDGDPARAPHVVNNSWSCTIGEGCTAPEILQAVVEAVRAAGIVTVQSAGNNGGSCETVTTPGAIYDASFTVGATDTINEIAFFSGRGPVTVDDSGRRKPDIVAPGVGIRSSVPLEFEPSGFGYAFLDGTSMAAPHVSGLVALLISADPELAGRVNVLETIISQSALHLTSSENCGTDSETSIPNNVYGWGRIDALAAYELLETGIVNFDTYMPVLVP